MSADVRTEFDEEDDSEPWYAVKSLIGTYRRASGVRISYEERVVLVRTNDFEKAYELAEDEAREHCEACSDDDYQLRCDAWIDAYHLAESEVGHRTEVYSRIWKLGTSLAPEEFVARFYDNFEDKGESGGAKRGRSESAG